jgi:hypothetical protein
MSGSRVPSASEVLDLLDRLQRSETGRTRLSQGWEIYQAAVDDNVIGRDGIDWLARGMQELHAESLIAFGSKSGGTPPLPSVWDGSTIQQLHEWRVTAAGRRDAAIYRETLAVSTQAAEQAETTPTTTPVGKDPAQVEHHDVFISHAGEDKESIARPLARALRELGYRVWFDEFELRIGMSLRRSIDKGLAGSRFGVVVLSPAFFGKEWPERELDGLAARETADGTHLILPIWHEVDRQTVTAYSPTLADRVAAKAADGLDAVIAKVVEAVGPACGAASSDPPIATADVQLTPVPNAIEMSPILVGTQLVRLIEAGLEIVLDLDSLPPGPGRRRTAKLFDELRDWLDAISEAGHAQRDELADQFSDQLRMLLDAGVVILGGTYKRTLHSPQGDEPWPGAAIRAVPLEQVQSSRPAQRRMSSEDATLLGLAQVHVDRGNNEDAEHQLRPVAQRGNSHAMLLLGMVLRDRGEFDESAAARPLPH